MAAPGHNGGPALLPGTSWRRHCWTVARERLLPVMPVEVVRLRVRRAQELGLDYRTYAGVRATTGHDLVAFLFSSNALRVFRGQTALDPDRQARLAALVECGRIGLATAPLRPAALFAASGGLLDAAHAAPAGLSRFGEAAAAMRAALGRLPGDRVLLVGDLDLERDWCAAGRLAGYLPAARYFAAP